MEQIYPHTPDSVLSLQSAYAPSAGLELIHPDTIDDSRLDPYRRTSDMLLRERGLFIAESDKVINRALDAGVHLRSLFLEEKWLAKTRPVLDRLGHEHTAEAIPVFIVTHEQFRAVTGYEVTRGALAVFERPVLPRPEALLKNARRVAILEDIVNYTNIGAAFRSAAALSIDAVLLTPSCHDPLYRRAARVSMGTVFQVPWTRIGAKAHSGSTGDWVEGGIDLLHRFGFKTVALALDDDALPLNDARFAVCERLALVLGTEGDGLADRTRMLCDWMARIPMAPGIDSLNVAAASAVAFWETRIR